MMTLTMIQATIDAERELLLPLKEKVSSSYLKQQCQSALYYLDDSEHFCKASELTVATFALQMAVNLRKFVDDCVSKWGYNAVAIPYDPRLR